MGSKLQETAMADPLTFKPMAGAVQKRRLSSSEQGEERVIKHRSSKACRSCRHRKVRCDVAAKGARCTNCELDGMECVVLPSRRGHSRRARYSSEQRPSLPTLSKNSGSQSVPDATYTRSPQTSASMQAPDNTGSVPAVVTFDEDVEQAATGPEQTSETQRDRWEDGPPGAFEVLLTPETRTDTAPQQSSPFRESILPVFIAPLPSRILPEDLEYLTRKGAFELPEPRLRVEIVQAYLFSVHPFMPMLEVEPFLRALQEHDGQISLLLFQAVMFAGCHSLPPDIIHQLGFQSPKQARQVFFNRARLLYDLNIEVDNTAILQSLLLMSSWYSKYTPWNERRHTWHWTGLAYDLARSIGLHREPGGNKIPPRQQRFRRRLWWSLYIRDRLIALGTRRPMRIQDNEYDVSMLTLDDFELEPSADNTKSAAMSLSKDEMESTALMCIQLSSLCIIVGRVVSSQYTTLGASAGASHTMMVMPRRDGDHTDELRDCERELEAWSQGLATNVRRLESSVRRDPSSCSEVHWAELNMTYMTTVNVLHRAEALRSQTEGGSSASPSKSKVKIAARNITRLGQDMLQHDQVRFLGLVGVTACLAASLTHMLDAGSTDEDLRDASIFRLQQCLQVLQALRQVYASADSAFAFLASVTRKAGMRLPMLSDRPSGAPASPASFTDARHFEATPKNPRSMSSWSELVATGLHSQPGDTGQPNMSSMNSAHAGIPSQRSRGVVTENGYALASSGQSSAHYGSQHLANTDGVSFQAYGTAAPNNAYTGQTAGSYSSDWVNSFDVMDELASLPFTYDFFSDAFGFLDGDMHGL